MQTNNNDFMPEPTIQSEHERGSNMSWLMLVVGLILGAFIAGGVFAAWYVIGGSMDGTEADEQSKREIKETILENMDDEYSDVLEEFPVALDPSDIHVLPSTDVDGTYDVFALLSINDPDFTETIEDAVREGYVPSGTEADDVRRVFVSMKMTESNGDWEVEEVNAYLGQSFWYMMLSLQEARARGREAAVMSTMNNLRALAELYYDDNDRSYSGLENDREFSEHLNSATENSPGEARCKSREDAYRCHVPLAEESSQGGALYYCIDATGTAIKTPTDPADEFGFECP